MNATTAEALELALNVLERVHSNWFDRNSAADWELLEKAIKELRDVRRIEDSPFDLEPSP